MKLPQHLIPADRPGEGNSHTRALPRRRSGRKRCMESTHTVPCISPDRKVVYPKSANTQISFPVVCGLDVKWADLLLKDLAHTLEKQVYSNSFI